MSRISSTSDIVSQAFDGATGAWTGADWTHEGPDGDDENYEDNDTSHYCRAEGDTTSPFFAQCGVCQSAASDAVAAEEAGQRALVHAEDGEWTNAEDEAQTAARLEGEYGDCPVWGPFLAAVKEARAASERYISIALAARHDAMEAGLPTNDEAIDVYVSAYADALISVAQDRGLQNVNVRVVPSYDGPDAHECDDTDEEDGDWHDLHRGLWQAAHDESNWGTIDVPADEEDEA